MASAISVTVTVNIKLVSLTVHIKGVTPTMRHPFADASTSSGRASPTLAFTESRRTLESREKGLSLADSMALSSCRCSAAFQSTAPRFAPPRTFSGSDPRAILAQDTVSGLKHLYQYQSRRVYNSGTLGRGGRVLYPGVDAFRYGVIVKEPRRVTSPFASTLPRLAATRPLEPLRRVTPGPELNARAYTYLPLSGNPR